MALSRFVGSFTTETGLGNKAYTGLGFQPKAVLFFVNGRASDGTDNNGTGGPTSHNYGFAIDSTHRFAVGTGADDNGTVANTNHDNTKCVCVQNWANNNSRIVADLVSMDADGFTLNYTTVNASAVVVNFIALAGADFSNAFIKEFQGATSTGNQALTGVGFKPDAIQLFSVYDATAAPHVGSSFYGLNVGFGVSSSSRGAMSFKTDNATKDTCRQSASKVLTVASGTASTAALREADLVSLDADGFTLNWTTVSAVADRIYAICFQGPQFKVGSFNQKTTTGSQATTGAGFQPATLMLGSWHFATSANTNTTQAHQSFGAGVDSSHRGTINWSIGTACLERLSRTNILTIENNAASPSVQAEADLTSLDSDGFTLNWGTADATAREILYFAIGAAAGGGGTTYTKTGAAIAPDMASGADSFVTTDTGSASGPGAATGADQSVWVETGTGTAPGVASGADQSVFGETGAASGPGMAGGADQSVFAETGTATGPGAASGADQTTFTETGTGFAPAVATGADQSVWVETGMAAAPGVITGASQLIHPASGNVYDKTGGATATGQSSGADQAVFGEAGTGAAPSIASGADSAVFGETGGAQAPGVGSGAKGAAGGGGTSWVPQEWGAVGPRVTMGEPHGLPAHEQRRKDELAAEFERLVNQIRDEDEMLALML